MRGHSKSEANGIVRSADWEQFLRATDVGERVRLQQALIQAARDSDLPALMSQCEGTGSKEGQALALPIMMALARQGRLNDVAKRRWLDLMRSLAVAGYPAHLAGRVAFRALCEHEVRAAEQLLLDRFVPTALNDEELTYVVEDLTSMATGGTAMALRCLQDVARLTGDAAIRAKAVLESLGVITSQELEALAAAWRKSRSAGSLNRLYHAYFNHLPEGSVSMSEIEELLGKPSERLPQSLYYETDAARLLLDFDERGRLRGRKLN